MSNVSYKFSMSTAQLNFFLDKIHDLLSIDDEILFKINKDNTLFYVVVGEKSNVNAFKSFIFKTNEVFSFTDDIPKEIRYIVKKGAKFESTIKNYLDYDENVQKGTEYAKKIVLDNLHNGEIILLHATSKDNSNILDDVIKQAKEQGYEFKNIDEFEK